MCLISRRNKCLHQQAETKESPGEQPSTYILRPGNINQSDSSHGNSPAIWSHDLESSIHILVQPEMWWCDFVVMKAWRWPPSSLHVPTAVAHVHGGLQRREHAGSRKSKLLKGQTCVKGMKGSFDVGLQHLTLWYREPPESISSLSNSLCGTTQRGVNVVQLPLYLASV